MTDTKVMSLLLSRFDDLLREVTAGMSDPRMVTLIGRIAWSQFSLKLVRRSIFKSYTDLGACGNQPLAMIAIIQNAVPLVRTARELECLATRHTHTLMAHIRGIQPLGEGNQALDHFLERAEIDAQENVRGGADIFMPLNLAALTPSFHKCLTELDRMLKERSTPDSLRAAQKIVDKLLGAQPTQPAPTTTKLGPNVTVYENCSIFQPLVDVAKRCGLVPADYRLEDEDDTELQDDDDEDEGDEATGAFDNSTMTDPDVLEKMVAEMISSALVLTDAHRGHGASIDVEAIYSPMGEFALCLFMSLFAMALMTFTAGEMYPFWQLVKFVTRVSVDFGWNRAKYVNNWFGGHEKRADQHKKEEEAKADAAHAATKSKRNYEFHNSSVDVKARIWAQEATDKKADWENRKRDIVAKIQTLKRTIEEKLVAIKDKQREIDATTAKFKQNVASLELQMAKRRDIIENQNEIAEYLSKQRAAEAILNHEDGERIKQAIENARQVREDNNAMAFARSEELALRRSAPKTKLEFDKAAGLAEAQDKQILHRLFNQMESNERQRPADYDLQLKSLKARIDEVKARTLRRNEYSSLLWTLEEMEENANKKAMMEVEGLILCEQVDQAMINVRAEDVALREGVEAENEYRAAQLAEMIQYPDLHQYMLNEDPTRFNPLAIPAFRRALETEGGADLNRRLDSLAERVTHLDVINDGLQNLYKVTPETYVEEPAFLDTFDILEAQDTLKKLTKDEKDHKIETGVIDALAKAVESKNKRDQKEHEVNLKVSAKQNATELNTVSRKKKNEERGLEKDAGSQAKMEAEDAKRAIRDAKGKARAEGSLALSQAAFDKRRRDLEDLERKEASQKQKEALLMSIEHAKQAKKTVELAENLQQARQKESDKQTSSKLYFQVTGVEKMRSLKSYMYSAMFAMFVYSIYYRLTDDPSIYGLVKAGNATLNANLTDLFHQDLFSNSTGGGVSLSGMGTREFGEDMLPTARNAMHYVTNGLESVLLAVDPIPYLATFLRVSLTTLFNPALFVSMVAYIKEGFTEGLLSTSMAEHRNVYSDPEMHDKTALLMYDQLRLTAFSQDVISQTAYSIGALDFQKFSVSDGGVPALQRSAAGEIRLWGRETGFWSSERYGNTNETFPDTTYTASSRSNFTHPDYMLGVSAILEGLAAGVVLGANISRSRALLVISLTMAVLDPETLVALVPSLLISAFSAFALHMLVEYHGRRHGMMHSATNLLYQRYGRMFSLRFNREEARASTHPLGDLKPIWDRVSSGNLSVGPGTLVFLPLDVLADVFTLLAAAHGLVYILGSAVMLEPMMGPGVRSAIDYTLNNTTPLASLIQLTLGLRLAGVISDAFGYRFAMLKGMKMGMYYTGKYLFINKFVVPASMHAIVSYIAGTKPGETPDFIMDPNLLISAFYEWVSLIGPDFSGTREPADPHAREIKQADKKIKADQKKIDDANIEEERAGLVAQSEEERAKKQRKKEEAERDLEENIQKKKDLEEDQAIREGIAAEASSMVSVIAGSVMSINTVESLRPMQAAMLATKGGKSTVIKVNLQQSFKLHPASDWVKTELVSRLLETLPKVKGIVFPWNNGDVIVKPFLMENGHIVLFFDTEIQENLFHDLLKRQYDTIASSITNRATHKGIYFTLHLGSALSGYIMSLFNLESVS